MLLRELYFYTATVKDWIPLLKNDDTKKVITDSLCYLVSKELIKVYAFVIMPNHLHLIWETQRLNGKELANVSFMKFTGHKITEKVKSGGDSLLNRLKVVSDSRKYNIWKRDSLAVHLYTPEVIYQKLEYIHNNPVQGKWMLVNSPVEYQYSSARFYDTGIDDFGFLSHIGEKI